MHLKRKYFYKNFSFHTGVQLINHVVIVSTVQQNIYTFIYSLYIHVCLVCSILRCSTVSDSATPWTVACQAPLSMGFSGQEFWSGLPCPPSGGLPGDLPDPGIEFASLVLLHWQVDTLSPGKPQHMYLFFFQLNKKTLLTNTSFMIVSLKQRPLMDGLISSPQIRF